jgi:hypothetical protein
MRMQHTYGIFDDEADHIIDLVLAEQNINDA